MTDDEWINLHLALSFIAARMRQHIPTMWYVYALHAIGAEPEANRILDGIQTGKQTGMIAGATVSGMVLTEYGLATLNLLGGPNVVPGKMAMNAIFAMQDAEETMRHLANGGLAPDSARRARKSLQAKYDDAQRFINDLIEREAFFVKIRMPDPSLTDEPPML